MAFTFPCPRGLKKARLLLAAKKHSVTAKHPCPTLHHHKGMRVRKVHIFNFRTIQVTQAQAMVWSSSHLRSQRADCQTFNPTLVWVAHHPKCGAVWDYLKNTCKLVCKSVSPLKQCPLGPQPLQDDQINELLSSVLQNPWGLQRFDSHSQTQP